MIHCLNKNWGKLAKKSKNENYPRDEVIIRDNFCIQTIGEVIEAEIRKGSKLDRYRYWLWSDVRRQMDRQRDNRSQNLINPWLS